MDGEISRGNIEINSILRVTKCQIHTDKDDYVADIKEASVIANELEMIGNPVKWEIGMAYIPSATSNNGSCTPSNRAVDEKLSVQHQPLQERTER